jgi:hypothetical protein
MTYLKKYVDAAAGILLMPLLVCAQPGKEAGVGNEQVNIVQEYKPVISPAEKIQNSPAYRDTVPPAPRLTYRFINRKPEYSFHPDTIKPARMKGEPLSQLFPGMLRLGGGNYNTFLFDGNYMSVRSKNWQYGAEAHHLSSSYMAQDYGRAGFSENRARLFGKYIYKEHSLQSQFTYNRDANRFFAIPGEFSGVIPHTVKNAFHYRTLEWSASAESVRRDTGWFRHKEQFQIRNTKGSSGSSETQFDLGTQLARKWGNEMYRIDAAWSYIGYTPAISNLNTFTITENIFRLSPTVELTARKWNAALGMHAFYTTDKQEVQITPNLLIRYQVLPSLLGIYLHAGGNVYRNGLLSLVRQNPFIGDFTQPVNTQLPLDATLGFRGNIRTDFHWDLNGSYKIMNRLALFYSTINFPFPVNVLQNGRYPNDYRFYVVYDDGSYAGGQATLSYSGIEHFDVGVRAVYNKYMMKNESKAWYQPEAEGNAWVTWKGSKKWEGRMDVIYRGNTYGRRVIWNYSNPNNTLSEVYLIKGYPDINLGVNYHHSTHVGAFARVCNIVGTRYQRWLDYPTQSVNVQAGLQVVF